MSDVSFQIHQRHVPAAFPVDLGLRLDSRAASPKAQSPDRFAVTTCCSLFWSSVTYGYWRIVAFLGSGTPHGDKL